MRVCRFWLWLVLGACLGVSAGCHNLGSQTFPLPDVPRENNKVTIEDYIIHPPDVVVIELIRAVPLPPYKIKAQDLLFIQVKGTPQPDEIKNVFRVEPEGIVRFGPVYGSVPLVDLTIDEAIRDITKYLKEKGGIKEPLVTVQLEQTRGTQLIRGEHLVRPDGTVNLGLYGRVRIDGKTQEQAKTAIEDHLSKFFLKPSISIDIAGFNSSVYYIIFDGGGSGEQVIRLPYTGSETVLDAIGLVYGLPAIASKSRTWLARAVPESSEDLVMPIDWRAITQRARTATNYQIYPSDRIYVAAQPLVTIDTMLGRTLAPVERLFGIVLLGTSTVQSFRGNNGNSNGGSGF